MGGSWANARAEGSSLRRIELLDMRPTGVDLARAVLEDVTVRNCRLDLAI